MVEESDFEMPTPSVVIKAVDGKVKVDFDIACRQSLMFQEMRDNFENRLDPADFSDTQSEFSTYNHDNEIEINLSQQSLMTCKLLNKIIAFWVYNDSVCAMPKL